MKLFLTNRQDTEVPFDYVFMSGNEFNDIHSHPWIINSQFDAIIVDLDVKVDLAFIRPLMKTSKVIPRITDNITSYGVSVLCEIYPDRAAELKVLYMRDVEALRKLVDELKDQFMWETFY